MRQELILEDRKDDTAAACAEAGEGEVWWVMEGTRRLQGVSLGPSGLVFTWRTGKQLQGRASSLGVKRRREDAADPEPMRRVVSSPVNVGDIL